MRLQPALPEGGQAIALVATAWLVGQCHLDHTKDQSRFKVGIPEMILMLERQRLGGLDVHGPFSRPKPGPFEQLDFAAFESMR